MPVKSKPSIQSAPRPWLALFKTCQLVRGKLQLNPFTSLRLNVSTLLRPPTSMLNHQKKSMRKESKSIQRLPSMISTRAYSLSNLFKNLVTSAMINKSYYKRRHLRDRTFIWNIDPLMRWTSSSQF
jgi:hypothetical protein